MNRLWLPVLLSSLLIAGTQQKTPTENVPTSHDSQGQMALHIVQQDVAIAEVLQGLRKDAPHGVLAFRNVRVVDPITERASGAQTVVVSDDRIVWIGDHAKEPGMAQLAKEIDGTGFYISPGLADMHVHSSSAAAWLLDLSNGVTTVREMAGFPWMLDAREKIKAGLMLGPTLAVAGPLINNFPLEGYAVVIKDPLDGRRSVRQQAACGYDFIKVWNVVPEPIFDAVAEQSRLEGMDLIGHVPQGISIPHAVQLGMRTMEHLKGFINDRTLQRGETDYSSLAGKDVWNTPTLYAGRAAARGQEARSYLNSSEMQYVPLRKREQWEELLTKPEEPVDKLRNDARLIMKEIVGELNAVHAHFLAGTDSDKYPFQVAGFALVDELYLLHDAGLSGGETIRSATTEAALAMREPDEFGQIRTGMRADFVLLDTDPLVDLSAFRRNRGVMAHGFWLARKELDVVLAKLARIYAEHDEDTAYSENAIRSTLERVESLNRLGVILDSSELMALVGQLRKDGYTADADRFEALANVPKGGPCAEPRPN
jgi:aryl carrier-like protein